MRSLLTLSLSLLASATPIVLVDTIHNGAAPILSASSYSKEIPDSYIVVFKKHVTTNTALEHHGWVQDIHFNTESAKSELRKRSQSSLKTDLFEGLKHTYNIAGGFLGYSGHFDEEVIEQVRRHPDVSHTLLIVLRVFGLVDARPIIPTSILWCYAHPDLCDQMVSRCLLSS